MPTPPMFPDAAIATMRAVQEANLPHSCQIKAQTLGARTGGVASETWNNVGAPVACRARVQGSPFEQLTADQLRNTTRYEVVLPISVTEVTRKHRLEVTGEFAGVTWTLLLQVEGPLGPKLAQTMRRYLCSPISGNGA
jgi:CRISPR/Cas system-associated exonuclease Cas4 (RecB family)